MTGLTSTTWLSWFGCWSSELGILIAIFQYPISNGNSYIAYTQSGLSWTTLQSPKNDTYSQPVWSPQLRLFAIIGLQYILTSNDGTTWTTISNPVYLGGATSGLTWPTFTWSSDIGIFCSIASGTYSSHCYSMTSSDGTSWTYSNSNFPVSTTCASGIYWASELGNFFAQTASIGVCYSSNGTTWTTTNNASGMLSILWAPELGIFIGGNYNDYKTWYSYDGINWATTSSYPNSHQGTSAWSPELGVFCLQNYGLSGGNATLPLTMELIGSL